MGKNMMIPLALNTLRSFFMAATFTGVAMVAVLPAQPAMAQMRGLPDFTDLVDQVGPSVVNIRTLERVGKRSQQGAPGEEEMLEFFKLFGLPIPNPPRHPPRQNRPQPHKKQPPLPS